MCNCGSVVLSTVSPIPELLRNSFLFLVSARLSSMSTSKKSPLAVTYDLPLIESRVRKAELIEEAGYIFIRYSGEIEFVDLTSETETDLLNLVKPFEEEADEIIQNLSQKINHEKAWKFPEIEPKLVLRFLNKWGMIGFRNELNFQNLTKANTKFMIARALGYHISPQEAEEMISKDFPERFEAITKLQEIPLRWIEEELRTLAFCVRLTNNLFRDSDLLDFEREEISLTTKNRMRIISSSPHSATLDFKDSEDPAKRVLAGSNFGKAEQVLDEFAGEINRYLRPLSVSVMRTSTLEHFYGRNLGFETALASAIAKRFRIGGSLLTCEECQNPYFPQRVRDDAKYCGQTCSNRVRSRRNKRKKRAEQKVSASKAGSKATPKARKEKK